MILFKGLVRSEKVVIFVQGAQKNHNFVIFGRKNFFLKGKFSLGVKLAEKHDSGVKKFF